MEGRRSRSRTFIRTGGGACAQDRLPRDKGPAIMGGHPADRVTPCSVRILGSWKAGGGPSHSAASRGWPDPDSPARPGRRYRFSRRPIASTPATSDRRGTTSWARRPSRMTIDRSRARLPLAPAPPEPARNASPNTRSPSAHQGTRCRRRRCRDTQATTTGLPTVRAAEARKAVVLKVRSPLAPDRTRRAPPLLGQCRPSGHRTAWMWSLTIKAT